MGSRIDLTGDFLDLDGWEDDLSATVRERLRDIGRRHGIGGIGGSEDCPAAPLLLTASLIRAWHRQQVGAPAGSGMVVGAEAFLSPPNPHRCPRCPACSGSDVTATLVTLRGSYCRCNRCGEVWHSDLGRSRNRSSRRPVAARNDRRRR